MFLTWVIALDKKMNTHSYFIKLSGMEVFD